MTERYWSGLTHNARAWLTVLGVGIVAYVNAHDDYYTVQVHGTRYPDRFSTAHEARRFAEATYELSN